ncbi:MAG: SRPBCC family protein [Aridibacter famidurans]|nr:SRPBCC family protein [Aridibacter famidurans]
MKKLNLLLGGIGIGAGLMYLLDPQKGRRRRAMLQDKARHLGTVGKRGLVKASHDISNRFNGLAYDARSVFRADDDPSDAVLDARVRSMLGRTSSNPHALKTHVEDGVVTIAGPVLEHEAEDVVCRTSRVRGVKSVNDEMERHSREEEFPSLQGDRSLEHREARWSPAQRLVAAGIGSSMAAYGAKRGDLLGAGLGAAGTGLLIRSFFERPLTKALTCDGGIHVQKTITIDKPVGEIFELCSKPERFPEFMSHVRNVERTGEETHRWTVDGLPGMTLTWDTRITEFDEKKRIAWKSVEDSVVDHFGELVFEEAEDGATRLSVDMRYSPPAGLIGHTAAELFGRDPKSEMDDDLLRMKSFAEKNIVPHDAAAKVHGA